MSDTGMSSQERDKINKLVEEVGHLNYFNNHTTTTLTMCPYQGAGMDSVTLDEAGVKKILLGFEKKVSRNQEMRIKFPDQPDKFMMSEMELHDAVRELQV